MELGVGYQLLGHGVDSFIYCNSKDCTSCDVSCTVLYWFCLTSVCVCKSAVLFSTHLPTRSCYCCGKNNCSESVAESLHSFYMANILSPCRPLTARRLSASCSSSEESQGCGFNAVRFALVRQHNVTRAQRKWITAFSQETDCTLSFKQKSRPVKKKNLTLIEVIMF